MGLYRLRRTACVSDTVFLQSNEVRLRVSKLSNAEANADVSRYRMFIGSVSCLYIDQTVADVYLSFAWGVNGQLLRVAGVCVSHGLSVAVVELGICPAVGVQPNVWAIHGASLPLIRVTDHGPQHMNNLGAQALLPNLPPAQPTAVHNVNGVHVTTKPIPWHHRVTLEQASGARLHYHQHARRRRHTVQPTRILPQNRGSYKSFGRLQFNTQVQLCRRIEQ